MKNFIIAPLACLSLVVAGAIYCPSANANLVINPVFDSTITGDSNSATIEATINATLATFEAYFANPVTVTINFAEVTNGLGQSATYQYDVSYSNYLLLLENNQTLSSYDSTALSSLGLTAPYTSNPTTNPVNGGATIQTTGPVFRAMGVNASPPAGQPDSFIAFNASLVDESIGTPPSNEYSLQAVISHEVDEVLGIGGGGSQLNGVYGGYTSPTGAVGPLDLFRYSGASTRSYTTGTGSDPYFSIDGGHTNLAYFNQYGSAGSDYGDWGNGIPNAQYGSTPPHVQDAYGTPGTAAALGPAEITGLDVIGWDLTAQGKAVEAIPEPGSVCLLLAGGLIALGLRRRRTARQL